MYHYSGDSVRVQQPRLLNFTHEDFQINVRGRKKEKLLDALVLEGVQFINNTFINSDYMFEMAKLGMQTFTGFVLNDNVLKTDTG